MQRLIRQDLQILQSYYEFARKKVLHFLTWLSFRVGPGSKMILKVGTDSRFHKTDKATLF